MIITYKAVIFGYFDVAVGHRQLTNFLALKFQHKIQYCAVIMAGLSPNVHLGIHAHVLCSIRQMKAFNNLNQLLSRVKTIFTPRLTARINLLCNSISFNAI